MDREIADRLRVALARLGMTMAELSKKSGMPYRSIQNYLSGKQNPGAEALIKIKEALGVNIDWILTGVGEMLDKSTYVVARDLCLDDYRELRARFTNFDEVFKFRDILNAPGIRDNPELSAEFTDYRPTFEYLYKAFLGLDPAIAHDILQGKDIDNLTSVEAYHLSNRIIEVFCSLPEPKLPS